MACHDDTDSRVEDRPVFFQVQSVGLYGLSGGGFQVLNHARSEVLPDKTVTVQGRDSQRFLTKNSYLNTTFAVILYILYLTTNVVLK